MILSTLNIWDKKIAMKTKTFEITKHKYVPINTDGLVSVWLDGEDIFFLNKLDYFFTKKVRINPALWLNT